MENGGIPEYNGERGGEPPFDRMDRAEKARLSLAAPIREDENNDHSGEEDRGLPKGTEGRFLGQFGYRGRFLVFVLPEEPRHDQTDHQAEEDHAHGAGEPALGTEDFRREDHRESVNGRAGVEERGRGTKARTGPDAGARGPK